MAHHGRKISGMVIVRVVVASAFLLISGCNTPEIKSRWRNQEVVIDGKNTEWRDGFDYRDEKSHVVLGVMNDRDALYLCVSTQDKRTSSLLLRHGLTVWLDSGGGEKKSFGVRFPGIRPEEGFATPPVPGRRETPPDYEKLLENNREEVEILTADNQDGPASVTGEAKDLGVAGRLGMSDGVLLYELRVPLTATDPRAFHLTGPDPGKPLGVGFETGEMERDKEGDVGFARGGRGRGRSGGMSAGQNGGRPGGHHGGKPGGGGGPESRPEPLELWTRIDLAGGN